MALYNKDVFELCPAMGFDGYFDWDWTKGCLGNNYITPMDIDGITERRGHFLIFETKNIGNPVPQGQFIALQKLYALGCFTVVFCDKVNPPTQMSVWTEPGFMNEKGLQMPYKEEIIEDNGRRKKVFHPEYKNIAGDPDRARNFIMNWYSFADNRQNNA